MKYTYRFPAVRGLQAGREYYISMVPLRILPKLFPVEDEIVLPEYRAQRRINEARIPDIKKYILDNRSTYVFSALSASIDGDFRFIPFASDDVGVLEVDMEAVFLINDGQHRKAAIEAALQEDESLYDETISIVFFRDDGLARSQQMFTDLNKHAVKTSNSLSTLYDTRDPVAVATRNVIDSVAFFTSYTDKERDILGKNSSNLFTLNTIYKANQRILHSSTCSDEDVAFLINYWSLVAKNITEWNEVMDRSLTKKSLREDYIITLSIVISALGKLGRYFYDHPDINMEQYLQRLHKIDWSRKNKDWVNKTIRENGKVLNGDEAIGLTCDMIKKYIGLE
ncbi:MAG: DNA sulfur modification protein DndB [Clostridia bacterium]|nr:DNA sulfur modification protein DndB [Clostridia bacterium]